MSARASRLRDRRGFTLIEVLVAFVVLATLLSVMYRGVVTLRQGANAFDDHTEREVVGRAVLDEALAERGLKPGVVHGVRDGHRWTIIARPIDLTPQLPPPAETGAPKVGTMPGTTPGQPEKREWATQRLTVRVESAGRPVEIETLRMVRVDP